MTGADHFGRLQAGDAVQRVTLSNGSVTARLITYGARLTELYVPDRNGTCADIVLGFDSLAEYEASDNFFGATCGRYANRIANGQITLDRTDYQLDRNEGANHLHGGRAGFDRKLWSIGDLTADCVTFTAMSADGDMGYPGECHLRTTYRLTADNRLIITMEAETTRTTLMNMVNHSYFNLAGHGSGDVLGQTVHMASHHYTPVNDQLLTTGEIGPVTGTPFDFTSAKPIGRDIDAPELGGTGYDHNWCLKTGGPVVEAHDPASGRRLTLATTEPGLQFYTGGYLSGQTIGKEGKPLCKYAGFTLETQKYPGTPQHAHFPSSTLSPGQTYQHRMEFRFTAD